MIQRLAVLFFILVAIHSLAVGLMLMFMPEEWFCWFGFSLHERFFASQGGAFHIILVPVYYLAAMAFKGGTGMHWVKYVVFVKCFAAIFLCGYVLVNGFNLMVLASGAGDGLMGLLALLFLKKAPG